MPDTLIISTPSSSTTTSSITVKEKYYENNYNTQVPRDTASIADLNAIEEQLRLLYSMLDNKGFYNNIQSMKQELAVLSDQVDNELINYNENLISLISELNSLISNLSTTKYRLAYSGVQSYIDLIFDNFQAPRIEDEDQNFDAGWLKNKSQGNSILTFNKITTTTTTT